MDQSQLRTSAAIRLLSAGIVLGWFGNDLLNSPKARAESQRYDRMQAGIDEMRQELQRTQTLALTARSFTPSRAQSAEEDLATAAPANPQLAARRGGEAPESSPAAEIATAEINEDFNSQFQSESIDSNWSTARSRVIQQRLGKTLPVGYRVVSVECKSSMCRAEVEHQDAVAHAKFVQDAFAASDPPWEGSTMVSLGNATGSGKVASVAFLGREGKGLSLEADQPQSQN